MAKERTDGKHIYGGDRSISVSLMEQPFFGCIDTHTKTLVNKWVHKYPKYMAEMNYKVRIGYSCAIHMISRLINNVHDYYPVQKILDLFGLY